MNVAPVTSSAPVASAAPAAFNPAALRNATPAAQRAAVAAQFEAILVRQMLGPTMQSMLGGEESGAAGSVYGDMLADTLAQQLTSGRGLGLSRFIEQQLTPRSAAAPAAGDPDLPPHAAASPPVSPVSST
jgi:Rod binding domain-containing protein